MEHATALEGFWLALGWGEGYLGVSEDAGGHRTPAIPLWVTAPLPSTGSSGSGVVSVTNQFPGWRRNWDLKGRALCPAGVGNVGKG